MAFPRPPFFPGRQICLPVSSVFTIPMYLFSDYPSVYSTAYKSLSYILYTKSVSNILCNSPRCNIVLDNPIVLCGFTAITFYPSLRFCLANNILSTRARSVYLLEDVHILTHG